MGISIALEGSEGAGKSLLVRLETEVLRETTDFPVMVRREPGGTDLGEEIRNILKSDRYKDMDSLTSAFLFSAQRSKLFSKVEVPFLRDNPYGILIKDRSWLSTVALQVAEGADHEYIELLQKPFMSIPDKFVIIDIPVLETVVRMESSFRYSSERDTDWRDRQTQENLAKYRQNYLSFAVKNKEKCLVLDCFDDPWVKAGQIKFEIIKSFSDREGKTVSNEERREMLDAFIGEARQIVQTDSEKDILFQQYGIEERRREVEETREKLNLPSKNELKAKMHEEWRSLGLEGFSSGIERGK